MAAALRRTLYHGFYVHGRPVPLEESVAAPALDPPTTSLARRLSEANAGVGCIEEWELVSHEPGAATVRRHGLKLRIDVGTSARGTAGDPDLRRLAPGDHRVPTAARSGRGLLLRLHPEFLGLSPGFYTFAGDAGFALAESGARVRLYWNLRAGGAADFVRAVTRTLNAAGLPFVAKVANRPEFFTRCDAAVLYLRKTDYARARALVEETIHPAVAHALKDRVPAFAKTLTRGVGLAEDPGGSAGFGEHRCGVLTRGLLLARDRGATSVSRRLAIVEEVFAAAGIDPERPFLNPGSRDGYAFGIARPQPARRRRRTVPRLRSEAPAGFLEAASSIGRRLCRDAIWHSGCCNWIGTTDARPASRRPAPRRWEPLGADLYDGTSGVAVFLAALHRTTVEPAVRRTALGAIRLALLNAETDPSRSGAGLYDGWVGMALVAARVGSLLGDDEAVERAAALTRGRTRRVFAQLQNDLVSGRAGAIVGLLALHDLLGRSDLLDEAIHLGGELVDEARVTPAGASWRVPAAARPLLGLSHGTAGIAFALLELARRMADDRYRTMAERALDYERAWFDSRERNWPDLRHEESDRTVPPRAFTTAWCHGAPGIALSRLHAHRVLGAARHRHEADTALATTRRHLEAALESESGSLCLCHGLAGNADVLLHARRLVSPGSVAASVQDDSLEVEAARAVIDRCVHRRGPTAGLEMETPGLMLGAAGMGYFLLRMHDPTVASVLLIEPATWGRTPDVRRRAAGRSRPGAGVVDVLTPALPV